jgi:hypothetical protein
MKIKPRQILHSLFNAPLMLILVFLLLGLILSIPGGGMLADSNLPTVTNSPVPSDTPVPDTAIPEPAETETETPLSSPPALDAGIIAEPTQAPTGLLGAGVSTIDVILIVLIGITVVLMIVMLVFIFRQQSQGGLGER